MDKFEGQIVGYMLGQARMPFFVTGSYPHYKIEGDRLVSDNSADSQALRTEANEAYELIRRIESRIKRGIRIPRTWTAKLKKSAALVTVLRQERVITQEWADEFDRSIRFLEAQTA